MRVFSLYTFAVCAFCAYLDEYISCVYSLCCCATGTMELIMKDDTKAFQDLACVLGTRAVVQVCC